MRGLGRLTAINKAYKPSLLPSSPLSTFAGGRGRGRGSGSNPPSPISFVPSNTEDDSNEEDRRTQIQHSSGLGHGGGGKPVNPTPVFPSFSPWVAGANPSMGRGKPSQPEPPSVNGRGRPTQPTQPEPFSVNGRGRPLQPEAPPTVGRGRPFQPQPPSTIGRGRPSEPSHQEHDQSKKPIFFRREEVESMVFSEGKKTHFPDSPQNEGNPPGGLFPGSSGAGRGKPAKPSIQPEKSVEVNRHIRPTASSPHRGAMAGSMQRPVGGQQLSRDEAVKRAREVLSRGGQEGGRGRGFRGQSRDLLNPKPDFQPWKTAFRICSSLYQSKPGVFPV